MRKTLQELQLKKCKYIFRATVNSHQQGFFLLHGGWGRGLLFFLSDRNGKRTSLRYDQCGAWKAGDWHHVAITWDLRVPGKSVLAMYVDYRVVLRRTGLDVPIDMEAWKQMGQSEERHFPLRAGSQGMVLGNWGGGKEDFAPYAFCLDDFRVYSCARKYMRWRTPY